MRRREFLRTAGVVLVLLPGGRVLVACGDDGDNGDDGDPGADAGNGNGDQTLSFTSSVDDGHTHQVSLQVTEIENPPSGGISENTSVDSGHAHTVSLSEEELQEIDGGGTVTKDSSVASGHSHAFAFSRAAAGP